MSNPERLKKADLLAIGSHFYQEQQEGYVDPHLRKRKLERTLPQGAEVTIQIQQGSVDHSKIFVDSEKLELHSKEDPRVVPITKTERDIIDILVKNNRKVVSHRVFNELVWGYLGYEESSLVKVHVYKLRRKLAQIGVDPAIIETQAGKGYRLSDVLDDEPETIGLTLGKTEIPEKKYHLPFGTFYPEQYIFVSEVGNSRLTKAECGMLNLLCDNTNRPVAHEYLAQYLQEDTDLVLIKTHINHIRKKIENGRKLDVPTIVGLHGVGYMIVDMSVMSQVERDSFLRNLSSDKKQLLAR